MKHIYIVLTHTGTALSRLVKAYTGGNFSHISISLDKQLNEMYSFGRLNPYNPFWGGFVHESIYNGTFKRFKNTQTEIYSLIIEDEQYASINRKIEEMKNCKEPYKFNIVGLFAVSINKEVHFKHSFYCAEFIKYLFDQAQIKTKLPNIVKPEDFKMIKELKLEYRGKLRDYSQALNK